MYRMYALHTRSKWSWLAAFLALLIPAVALADVDLVVNNSDSPDPVMAGGTVTYTVTVANNGLADSPSTTLSITLPSNGTYLGYSSSNGITCGAPAGGVLTCDAGSLQGDPTYQQKTVAVQVASQTQGSMMLVASATTTGTEDNPTDNTDISQSTTVNTGADIAAEKTASSGTVQAGGTLAYTLSATNRGPNDAVSIRISDPVPTGFNITSLPAGCANAGGVIQCDIANLAVGATSGFSPVTGTVSAASGSTLTNAASVGLQPGAPGSPPQDGVAGNNTVSVDTSVTAGSDVAIGKARSAPGPFIVGDSFDYVLTPSYTGDAPNNLTVTDTVPSIFTIVALATSQNGWSCSAAGQVVTCTNVGGGSAGNNVALGTITIPVTANASGSASNTATVSAADPGDPNQGNNSASDGSATVNLPNADLAIAKSGPNPALVAIGQDFNYTLSAGNGGPSPFYGTLTVTDNLPAGLTLTSITAAGWTCSPAPPPLVVGSATLTCERVYTVSSPLASGANAPAIQLAVTTTTAGSISNSASVSSADANVADLYLGNNSTSYNVSSSLPTDSADLAVIKTVVGPDPVAAGDVLHYRIELVNNGIVTSTTVEVFDQLLTLIDNQAGVGHGVESVAITAQSATVSTGCTTSSSGANSRYLSCGFASVPFCIQGTNCALIDVLVRPGGSGTAGSDANFSRGNTAQIVGFDIADPIHANDSSTVSSQVMPRADVQVTKVCTPGTVSANTPVTCVVTVKNNGPSRANDVSMTDNLPDGVLFVSAAPSVGSCLTQPSTTTATSGGAGIVGCALGNLDNGVQQTVTIVFKPTNITQGTTINDTASATTSTTEIVPPGATNNSATASTVVNPPVLDLVINKSDSVDPVAVGDNTTYTVTVTNSGPSDAENAVLTDTLPATGLAFISAAPGAWSCTTPAVNSVGGTITCTLPRLPANTTRILTVDMQGVAKGAVTNHAVISSDEVSAGWESPTNNNSVNEQTTVRTKADLEVVSKTPSVNPVNVRDDFNFVVKVRNNAGSGLAEADGVVVSDMLPAGMALTGTPTVNVISGTTTSTTCTGTAGGTSFTCTLGTVSSGGEVDITVPVQLVSVSAMPQTFTNSASVSTTSKDVSPTNNSNSGSVTVNSSSIAGRVFRDFNNNSLVTADDTGISGIIITLTGTTFDSVTVNRSVTTDASGNYIFTGVPQGTYTVAEGVVGEAHLVDGIDTAGTAGGDATSVNDRVSAISLPANTTATGYTFAELPIARIGVAKVVQAGPTVNADGTFNTTFRLRIKNFSLEAVNNLAVVDTLNGSAPHFGTFVTGGSAALLANGNYTVQSAPSGSCSGLNAGFDGSGNTGVATLPSLAAGASCTIDFTVRVRPTAPLPTASGQCGSGRYCNQASITGAGALSGQAPTDLSDSGSNIDTNSNGIPNEAGENDPTPVSPGYAPAIGIVKQLNSNVSVQPDNSILVPIRLVVSNPGNEPLSNVAITDPLSTGAGGLFGGYVSGGAGATLAGGQYTVQTAPTFSGACSNGSVDAAFTGHTGNLTVASITNMATAASCTIDFTYRFMPTSTTIYSNQAAASGTSDFTTTPVTQNSAIAAPYPRVALAKRVNTTTTTNADGTVTVPFQVLVKNTGGEMLNGVTVIDGLTSSFGAFVAGGASATLTAGQYTVQSAPAFSGACAGGTANAAYTGDAASTVASINGFAVNASCTANFSLRFRPQAPLPAGGYANQASVSATGVQSGLSANDLSDDGVNPDTNNNGIGNEAGENDPTPVAVSFTPRIGLAKSKPVAETINANGTVTVPFRIKVQNYGTEPLTGVTVSDLTAGVAPAFGNFVAGGAAASLSDGEYTIEAAPVIQGACAAATLTPGFTGQGGGSQIASLTRLEIGAFCEFNFTLRFKPQSPTPSGGYSNVATGSGTGELSSGAVSDTSNNGTNPDGDSNGDPTNDNAPTPVNFTHTSSIGIAKALWSGLAVNGNGSYTGTFRLVVKNLGNEELNNVAISDAMNGAAPRFGAFVAGGAGATLAAGQYTVQGVPRFVGACANGSVNAGFDGSAAVQAATITLLPINGTCALEFDFRFFPQPGQVYANQATTTGTGAFSGNPATDMSGNGSNPDPNGNSIGNESGENDPTPVPIPRIGVAKLAGAVANNGDGTYSVPFTLTLNNAGEMSLNSVQITDTLAGQFGAYTASATPAAGQYTISSGPAVNNQINGAAITAVAAGVFTGSGAGNALLLPASSALPNFGGTASSAGVTFTIRFFPTSPGPFTNTALASGASSAGGNVSDNSVNGAVPDANGNGDPGDDASPTMVNLAGQVIGAAKSVSGIVQTGAKKFRIPYTLVVQNVSATVTATNVQVTDNLSATFPTAQSISVATPVAISGCTGTVLTVATPAFTGIGQNKLLAGNQNLQPDERCTLTFTTEVDFGANPLPTAIQNNQAVATTAQAPGGTVIATDLSDDGNVPDPNGNGNAGDAGENDPTPVSFAPAGLSAVSGTVYLDANHNRSNDDPLASSQVQGFIVEVLNASGAVVGTATTDASGNYTVGGLFPSTTGNPATYYSVRFREPVSGAIYGLPQSADPTPSRNGTITNGVIVGLQLTAGATTLNQNLPLDPTGVVYDSITRNPIAGAQVTLLNGGGPVAVACLVGGINTQTTGPSGQYQFLLVNPAPTGCPGSGVYTLQVVQPGGYLPPDSLMIPPSAGPYTPTNGGVDAIQAQSGPPAGAAPTAYYTSFLLTLTGVLGTSSSSVVNNHIPLDPILEGAILLAKTTPKTTIAPGNQVPYTITATNTLGANLTNVDLHDLMPAGFSYVPGTAKLDGVQTEPTVNGSDLTWANLTFTPNQQRQLQLTLVAGNGVMEGDYVNTASALNSLVGAAVSNTATAKVQVMLMPIPAMGLGGLMALSCLLALVAMLARRRLVERNL